MDVDKLPYPEREKAKLIEEALSRLNGFVEDFEAAVALFDWCEEQVRAGIMSSAPRDWGKDQLLRHWKRIAGRDGAMTIYHFVRCLRGIETTKAQCPTLSNVADKKLLKSANKMLHAHFKDFEDVRDAVAHVAEKRATVDKLKTHAASIPGRVQSLTITNGFQGRRFQNTWKGKVLSYELSEATLENLAAMKKEICAAFGQVWPQYVEDRSSRPVVPPPHLAS